MTTLSVYTADPTALEDAATIERALHALGPVSYMVYEYRVTHSQLGIWLMKDGQFRPKVGKLVLGDCGMMRGEFYGRNEHIASLAIVEQELRLTIGSFEVTALRAWFGDANEVGGE